MSFIKILGKTGKVAGKVAGEACKELPGILAKVKGFFDNIINKDSNLPIEIGNPVKISVIAPRGFGKTSLISCMYQEIEKIKKPLGMEISTDDESKMRLDQFAKDITDMITAEKEIQNNIREVAIQTALEGTSQRKEFRFDINLKTKEKKGKTEIERVLKQAYEIQDIPGKWIDINKSGVNANEFEKFESFLKDSTILYIPIDATVLMSADSEEEKDIAKNILEIGNVRNIVMKWLNYNRNKDRKCSLFFVPIKCEYYLRKPTTAEKLKQKVMEKYGELCREVKASGFIDAYYVPVETLGCVEFAYGKWNIEDKYFECHFTTQGSWYRKYFDILAADIFVHSAIAINEGIREKHNQLETASFKDKLTKSNLKAYKNELKIVEGALKPMIETFEHSYEKDLIETYRI